MLKVKDKGRKQLNLVLGYINKMFARLSLDHWMQGKMGDDWKMCGKLLEGLYVTFKNEQNKPARISKT